MKIWLVQRSESTPHDGIGEERSMRMGILAQTLAQRGHTVTWWTSTFDHFKHQHRYETNTPLNVCDNYRIYYIRGFGYQKNISFSRIWDNVLLAKRFAALIRQEPEKPDVIIASVPTAELAVEAVRYANQSNIPIVLDIRDLWPDVVYDLFPNYTHYLLRLAFLPMTWNLKGACSGASAIIGLTDPFVDWGIANAGRTKSAKDRVFPMGYWSNKLDQHQEQLGKSFWENKNIYKSDDCLLVTFFGTLGKTNDLLPVIKAAKFLEAIDSKVKFVVCGAGQKLSLLEEEAKNLSNIIFPGWINASQILTLLQIADVGICPYINSVNYVNNIPNKPPEYLSSGLILALSLSHGVLYDLIKDNNIGFSYSNASEVLADELDSLSKNPQRLKEMKSNALDTFNKFFDGEFVYNQMATYLENLFLKQSNNQLWS